MQEARWPQHSRCSTKGLSIMLQKVVERAEASTHAPRRSPPAVRASLREMPASSTHPGLADLPLELLELIVEPLGLKERWVACQGLRCARRAPAYGGQ